MLSISANYSSHKAGASVLFTIHQPASEVFATFDHLILLNKGRVMYQGSVKSIPDFFGARGYPIPSNYNPADWIIVSRRSQVYMCEHGDD